MRRALEELKERAFSDIAAARRRDDFLAVKTRYLGRRGLLTELLRSLKDAAPEERPALGKLSNDIKEAIARRIDEILSAIEETSKSEARVRERIDVTLPGRGVRYGTLHPVTQVMDEICHIFSLLGFSVAEGPEVELDYYNFEALNIPKDHPARDMQDTFYIADEIVLRTHTSPVQIRTMEKQKPPVRILSPGKVYRPDSDVSHTPMFHQVEGLLVDTNVTFGDLKGVLTFFSRKMFGEDTNLRFRPSFFPFTEPSAEVDIRCVMCKGSGCRLCKQTGWLEILGSGMVDPELYKVVGYDPEKVSGFAFGLGVERIALLKYGISDIRLFFENDKRFLDQF
ncbi:MAG: phenylalanine--tRNA ligase subunit alpha [Deltaproteobacteria bacterium]|nr:phenylalanine--tRNA ligase subunit alpha [Deltaproteobacteria bacterium]